MNVKKYPSPVWCTRSTVPRQINPIIDTPIATIEQKARDWKRSDTQHMTTIHIAPFKFGAIV